MDGFRRRVIFRAKHAQDAKGNGKKEAGRDSPTMCEFLAFLAFPA
jgi:hypothetical protein